LATWIALAVGGCEGDIGIEPVTSDGGSGASTTTTSSSSDGGGSGLQCAEPLDGLCDDVEDCECALCQPAALCQPTGEGCVLDYWCLEAEDACTCSDCDFAGRCFSAHTTGCNQDGACDFATEGCGCSDCWDEVTCRDNGYVCDGGAPDGICDPLLEDCACNDCLGDVACLCPDPTDCPWNACVCPGCWVDEWCTDPIDCKDDGLCAWDEWEGCHCADCAALSICQGYPG
jgi:hypothetical protein